MHGCVGCVICNNEYAFGVCIEMEWVWVTMTNSSKWSWSKCLLLSCDEFFCTLLVKSLGVLQFSVSLLSVLMVHHQHCMNTKTSNVDKCVFVLKNCVSHFFLLSFFMTAIHYSSSHSPNEHTTTWIYTHSLIVPTQIPYLSQKANSRNACQMRRLHMMVSLIIDKKHESMKDVKMMTSNNIWNTLYNDYFAD